MTRLLDLLCSAVIAAATAGASLLAASFVLSAAGDQRSAASAFLCGVFLTALFGLPALRIGLKRARARQEARLRAHIDQHGLALYERYVVLTRPGRIGREAAVHWRREVEQFRRSMKRPTALIGGEDFYELVTQHVAALREKARGWGKRPSLQQPVSIALPRRVEAEFVALGWRAKAAAGPGVLGPVVLAARSGVRVVLRCERHVLTRDRAERARALKQYYRADIAGIVCAGPIDDEARAFCARTGIVVLPPGGARAIYPFARQVWRERKEKRDAVAAGVRARAQAAGR